MKVIHHCSDNSSQSQNVALPTFFGPPLPNASPLHATDFETNVQARFQGYRRPSRASATKVCFGSDASWFSSGEMSSERDRHQRQHVAPSKKRKALAEANEEELLMLGIILRASRPPYMSCREYTMLLDHEYPLLFWPPRTAVDASIFGGPRTSFSS